MILSVGLSVGVFLCDGTLSAQCSRVGLFFGCFFFFFFLSYCFVILPSFSPLVSCFTRRFVLSSSPVRNACRPAVRPPNPPPPQRFVFSRLSLQISRRSESRVCVRVRSSLCVCVRVCGVCVCVHACVRCGSTVRFPLIFSFAHLIFRSFTAAAAQASRGERSSAVTEGHFRF